MFVSLYFFETGHTIQGILLMDLTSFLVASGIDRGPFILFFSPVSAVCEHEKSLHVAIGFTVTCHKYAFHVHVALAPIWNLYKRKSFVGFYTFALYVHVTWLRLDGIPAVFFTQTAMND